MTLRVYEDFNQTVGSHFEGFVGVSPRQADSAGH